MIDNGLRPADTREILIGRAEECALFDNLATNVHDGFSGSLVFIGEPGVGKTRLLQYLQDSAIGVTTCGSVERNQSCGWASLHCIGSCCPIWIVWTGWPVRTVKRSR